MRSIRPVGYPDILLLHYPGFENCDDLNCDVTFWWLRHSIRVLTRILIVEYCFDLPIRDVRNLVFISHQNIYYRFNNCAQKLGKNRPVIWTESLHFFAFSTSVSVLRARYWTRYWTFPQHEGRVCPEFDLIDWHMTKDIHKCAHIVRCITPLYDNWFLLLVRLDSGFY